MNVTDIIKHKEVREFLLDNFPKPIVDRKETFPEIVSIENKNPSLTGNAFEFFLRILSAKSKLDLENEFENERRTALWNIKRTFELKSEPIIFKDHLRIWLNKGDYESKIGIIKKFYTKNQFHLMKFQRNLNTQSLGISTTIPLISKSLKRLIF